MLINSLPYKGKIVQRSLKAFICVEIDSPVNKVASSYFLGVLYCICSLLFWLVSLLGAGSPCYYPKQELGIQVEAEANEVLPSLFYHLKNRFFKENKNSHRLNVGMLYTYDSNHNYF